MNKQLEYKKPYRNQYKSNKLPYFEDEISDMGRKGGKVEKERELEHQIDLELRRFTYR